MINSISTLDTNKNHYSSVKQNNFLSYINSEQFKNTKDEEKIWFLIYMTWISNNPNIKSMLSQLLQYLEITNPQLIKQSENNYTFNIKDILIQNWEWEKVFNEVLSSLSLSNDVIHNTLSKIDQNRQSILSKIKIFKLLKYKLWYDKSSETLWNAIKDLKFVALRWTHWDEIWALEWTKELEWTITTYLVNPEAVEKWSRESDEDINRITTPWSNSNKRKTELFNKISQDDEWYKYVFDFHNCNGDTKLWCVNEYNIKHELIAKSLWLDALLIFDKTLSNWTIVDSISEIKKTDGMVIEVWKEIDHEWLSTMKISQSLLKINNKISLLKQLPEEESDNLTIQDLSEILLDTNTKKEIPIIYISVLKDEKWVEIIDKENIDPWIPSHCIQFKQWIDKYIIIKNKDGSYPTKDILDKTLFNM